MEIQLGSVAIRFIKYTDSLRRYAIFEIGRISAGELEALGKAYTPILCRLVGDPTNGNLQKKSHCDADFYTARICLFVGDICDGKDLIEKESDRAIVTITYTSFNMRPTLKAIKHCGFDTDETWFKHFPVNWDDYEYASSTDTAASEVKEEAVMETSFDLTAVALRFVKYVDFTNTLHRYAIFEIGRVGNIELKALEKAYASQPHQLPGDLTNGILQKKMHHNSGCYTVRLCLFIGNILDGADLIEKESDASKVTITYAAGNIRPSLKSIKRMTAYGRPWFERFSIDWDNHEDTPSTDTTKTSEVEEEKEMKISEKIKFQESAPKKWVDLYTLLYDHFAHYCHRVDATLHQRTFSYSNRNWYPAGIDFYIMKRNSSDGKDKFKFSVFYDELTKQVTLRFFASNVDIVIGGDHIHESSYCEPIISVFLFDKPRVEVKSFDITNGDTDNKMEHDWRPLDILQTYFGDMFWDRLVEIFSGFIPKQTEIFYENILKSWNSDPKYQFFNYIQEQFSKFTKEWFHGTVKKIVKSINAVDWEVMLIDSDHLTGTNSSRKYRFELRHRIDVKDINDISDDNLAFYKIDPICGVKRIIPCGLDHEFGNGFQSHIELIYNRVRTKINEFVEEEKKMKTTITKEFMQKEFSKLCGIIQNEIQPILNDVALLGGGWNAAGIAGLMYWYVYGTASYRDRYIGARLLNDDTLAVYSGEKHNNVIEIRFSTDYTNGVYIRMDDLKRHQMHEPITTDFFETLYIKCMNAFEDDLWKEIGYPSDIKAKKKTDDIDESEDMYKLWQKYSETYLRDPKLKTFLPYAPSFENVDRLVFNGPATIVYWKDGTMTVVKATKGETIDPEKGFAMAALKKVNGNTANYMRKLSKLFKKAEIIEPTRKKKTKKTNTDIVATANTPKKTTKKKVDPTG